MRYRVGATGQMQTSSRGYCTKEKNEIKSRDNKQSYLFLMFESTRWNTVILSWNGAQAITKLDIAIVS